MFPKTPTGGHRMKIRLIAAVLAFAAADKTSLTTVFIVLLIVGAV
jgi:hypothetical protein